VFLFVFLRKVCFIVHIKTEAQLGKLVKWAPESRAGHSRAGSVLQRSEPSNFKIDPSHACRAVFYCLSTKSSLVLKVKFGFTSEEHSIYILLVHGLPGTLPHDILILLSHCADSLRESKQPGRSRSVFSFNSNTFLFI